ncbi:MULTISPECIES: hypothetical protein [Paraburkholderia]|uniref:hypothetical protein n=1 Tax=Paraburkholderia TaxID=1822464 RepID=UPI0013ED3156|nr:MULTISPECIES: hypothetical protein [Paraburkholderia]MDR8401792.1 hypothetical protein [Paraburkholderia sp. USG1]
MSVSISAEIAVSVQAVEQALVLDGSGLAVVELLDEDGNVVDDVNDSLWGIESEAGDYLKETAQDMAEGLAQGLQREARERMYWNARDMVTV